MASIKVEVRADAREVERRTHELPAHAAALRREVVVDVAVRGGVAHGAKRLAVVHELGSQDPPVANELAVAVFVLVNHVEAVARPNVEREIDIPPEDVIRESQYRVGTHAGGARRDE